MLSYLSPDNRLEQMRQALLGKWDHLSQRMDALLLQKETRYDTAWQKLHALSPLAILQRGYGVVHDHKGSVVTSVSNLQSGDTIRLLMRDGEADATIGSIYEKTTKEESYE